MSPPPRSRSGTRRRMGSESPPGSAGPPPWSMESRRPILKPAGTRFALLVRQLDQPGEPAGHGGLRHRRVGPRRELPQGERRVAETELGRTLQRRGQVLERPAFEQRARGLELRARRTALPDEIRVVGVREPVRVRAKPCDEGAFLEREHGLRCPRRPRGTPRSRPSSSRRQPSASRGRSRACERRRPTRRCGRTPHLRGAASAPRDAASAARSASPHPGRRLAGRPTGSRRGRRRVRAAGRAAAPRGRAHPPRSGPRSCAASPRREAACARSGRTRDGGTCGSPSRP